MNTKGGSVAFSVLLSVWVFRGLSRGYCLPGQEEGRRPWHQSYWFRLALSYLGVIVLGVVVVLIWPYVMMVLMDSGII